MLLLLRTVLCCTRRAAFCLARIVCKACLQIRQARCVDSLRKSGGAVSFYNEFRRQARAETC